MKFLLDQGSFCGATGCSYFGLYVALHLGFKARVALVNLRVTSCATPVFSTNKNVNCMTRNMYTAGLSPTHPSCKQWRTGSNFGPLSQQMSMHHIGKFKEVHPTFVLTHKFFEM